MLELLGLKSRCGLDRMVCYLIFVACGRNSEPSLQELEKCSTNFLLQFYDILEALALEAILLQLLEKSFGSCFAFECGRTADERKDWYLLLPRTTIFSMSDREIARLMSILHANYQEIDLALVDQIQTFLQCIFG